ncbi:MAG TPA: FG-GAP-like repeat-containing protein [Pyrinomonadaceae bacterium]|nr:FG-GAP-like repeat-containing protein [Pyrinomonadaceae bacterium]
MNSFITSPRAFFHSLQRRSASLTAILNAVLVLSFAGTVQRAAAQEVKFTSPVTYTAGAPYVVTSGDFNGDGKADVVAGDITHSDLVMLLGNGDGTLRAPLTYHQAAQPYYLSPNDFNRDGKLDLATANPNAGNITILLGKGDGTFETPVNYSVGRLPTHIRAADFNRDGWLDIAVFGGNKDVNVLLNLGHGVFDHPQSYPFTQLPGALAVGDANSDGNPDLIIGMRDVKAVYVMLGNGNGTFQPFVSSDATAVQNGTGPYSIVAGDFDRDGKLDVALSDETLKIMKGNGDGTFRAPSFNTRLRNTSADLKSGDLNGDGKLELISAGVFASGAIQVLLGGGDGTFQDAGEQVLGSTSVSVVVADLNGDTKSDLAANINNQLAVALVNVTPGDPDDVDYFVHQHYVDFLDREPDASGFGFWRNQITSCTTAECIELKRINVSAAFYLAIEFQQTAYLVERMYKAAYGDATGVSTTNGRHELPVPIVRLNEFLLDTKQLGQGVVVNQPGWSAILESNKQIFMNQFVERSRFTSAFPSSMTPQQFIDKLNTNAGNVLTASDKAAVIGLFDGANDISNVQARASALRLVAENQNLYNAEFNRAFVLTQYFGYLRRNPNEGRDTDYSGYDYWLTKLNSFNGNFVNAEMVKAFIVSAEYRERFTQ